MQSPDEHSHFFLLHFSKKLSCTWNDQRWYLGQQFGGGDGDQLQYLAPRICNFGWNTSLAIILVICQPIKESSIVVEKKTFENNNSREFASNNWWEEASAAHFQPLRLFNGGCNSGGEGKWWLQKNGTSRSNNIIGYQNNNNNKSNIRHKNNKSNINNSLLNFLCDFHSFVVSFWYFFCLFQ